MLHEEFVRLRNPFAAMTIQQDRPGAIFLDDNRLVVYEVDSTGKLSSRAGPDVSSAFQLHASIFSAETGSLESTKDWPTRAHYSGLLTTAGGLLVRTGETLTLLSKDFMKIDKRTLPDFDRCILSVSATQQTILANCLSSKRKISQFDVLDGNTLRLKYSWSESPALYPFYSVTDTGIGDYDESQRALIFSKFASRKWDAVARPTGQCTQTSMMVIADQWILNECRDVSARDRSNLTLSSMDGQILMTDQFEKDEKPSDDCAVSQNGRVFALTTNTIRIQQKFLAEPTLARVATTIAVYDFYTKKRILTVNVSPLPDNDFDVALSPSGSKLAVLNDRRVSVYSVLVK